MQPVRDSFAAISLGSCGNPPFTFSFQLIMSRWLENHWLNRPRAKCKTAGRRGAAVVEFAFVAPLLIVLALGMAEFGRMLMVQQMLTNGAREGARKAVLPGVTEEQARETMEDYFSACRIEGYTLAVSPDPAEASGGTAIQVTASVPYADVSWFGMGMEGWMRGATLSARVEMRKEE